MTKEITVKLDQQDVFILTAMMTDQLDMVNEAIENGIETIEGLAQDVDPIPDPEEVMARKDVLLSELRTLETFRDNVIRAMTKISKEALAAAESGLITTKPKFII